MNERKKNKEPKEKGMKKFLSLMSPESQSTIDSK
jgi:hypothetical protein